MMRAIRYLSLRPNPHASMRRLLPLLLLIAVLLPTAASAQIRLNWQPSDDLNALLPPTIRAFSVDTVVQRGANQNILRAYLVVADTNDANWTIQGLLERGGKFATTTFALDADAFVAINGGYFDTNGTQSFSLVASKGEVLVPNIGALNRPAGTYRPTRSAFGLLDDGTLDVAWIYDIGGTQYAYPNPAPNTESTPAPTPTVSFPEGATVWNVKEGMGGGPVLVENGVVRVTWEEEVFFGSGIGLPTSVNSRTGVGYTADGKVLMIVADKGALNGQVGTNSFGVSLIELGQLFVDLGAVEAINLDGGGSSTMVIANQLVNRPGGSASQRPVPSVLVLARAPEPDTTDVGPPSGRFFFDADPALDTYSESADWFASANTPFYGTAPGRLNAADGGGSRATFVLNGIEADNYTLDAWWVASFNRTKNTPFIIYQKGVPTTVRVDQSDPGTLNTWTNLGTFDLAPGDSVVVTDDASGTSNPSFVMTDGLRLTSTTTTDAATPSTLEASTDLRAWPSPSTGQVTLARSGNAPAAIGEVYDVLGRRQQTFSVSAGQQRLALDLTGLPSGLYLIRLESGSETQTTTVVLGPAR